LQDICEEVKSRATSVETGRHLASGPLPPLPPSIFDASGDWQRFSTPLRDFQLRASLHFLANYVRKFATGKPEIARPMADIYRQQKEACHVTYTNSAGRPVNLTLDDVQERLFQLSFDPYHCAEMRWGAFPAHRDEYSTCTTADEAH